MGKTRIDTPGEGVIATIVTITALALKASHGAVVKRGPRYRRRTLLGIAYGLSLYAILPAASAGTGREDGDTAFRKGAYQEAAIAWFGGSLNGDSEQQELLADVLFGPHASAVRHHQYDGIQYLYQAAAGGRQSAMRKLSVLLRTGSSGAKKDADAARCWAAAPTSRQGIRTCMAGTEFRPKSIRVSCRALVVTDRFSARPDDFGAEMSKLCIANKTPALLVPGTPPSASDMRRVREYARHGIEFSITGDVYNGNFERFSESFNNTTVAAIESERGKGYLELLSEEIERRIGPDRR